MFPDPVGSTPSPVDDPLAMPAAEVDTRFPRLQPDRIYRFNIESAETTTSDKGVEMLSIAFATTKEEIDTDGKVLHPGFKLFHRVVTSPTGKMDIEMIKKNLGILLKGLGKDKVPMRQIVSNPEQLVGMIVDAKVGIQKAKDGYPESNKIVSFIPPTA